jgi:hypothetical protein
MEEIIRVCAVGKQTIDHVFGLHAFGARDKYNSKIDNVFKMSWLSFCVGQVMTSLIGSATKLG